MLDIEDVQELSITKFLKTDLKEKQIFMLVPVDKDTTFFELQKGEGFIIIDKYDDVLPFAIPETSVIHNDLKDMKAEALKAVEAVPCADKNSVMKQVEKLAEMIEEEKNEKKTKKQVDVGKILALKEAGWKAKDIAGDMGLILRLYAKY